MAAGGVGITLGKGALIPLLIAAKSFSSLVTSPKGRNLMTKMSNLGTNVKAGTVNPIIRDVFKHIGYYPAVVEAAKHNNRLSIQLPGESGYEGQQ